MTLFENPVGQSLPRLELREKLTGQAAYTDDLYRPHMLHGAILHSPYPHARIVGYDIAQAEALSGVCAVVTGDDIGRHYMGPFIKDEPALAKDKVRYIGEPVAAVAAVDIETAQQAARLIDVMYEELPAVFDPQEAARPGAPLVHETLDGYIKTFECERGGNIMATIAMAEGDVDKAWADCDVIVEGVFETQAQNHAYIEPSSALAEVDANGKLTVWSSNQSVFRVQAQHRRDVGIANVARPLRHATGRRRLRRQDGINRSAAHRVTRSQGAQARPGNAHARGRIRDGAQQTSGAHLDQNRRP